MGQRQCLMKAKADGHMLACMAARIFFDSFLIINYADDLLVCCPLLLLPDTANQSLWQGQGWVCTGRAPDKQLEPLHMTRQVLDPACNTYMSGLQIDGNDWTTTRPCTVMHGRRLSSCRCLSPERHGLQGICMGPFRLAWLEDSTA